MDQSEVLNGLLPKPLKHALVERPADLPHKIDQLLSQNTEDERVLSSAKELQNAIRARVTANNNGEDVINVPDVTPALRTLASDAEARQLVGEQVVGAAALGRRLGAGLFRRAAYRAQKSPVLSERSRKRIVKANNALADAIDPARRTTFD